MTVGPWLTRWHRRLATLGVLPLSVWLVSALAMPFVHYPAVDSARRLETLPALGPHAPVAAPAGCAGGLVMERLPMTGLVARCLEEPWVTSSGRLGLGEAQRIATDYAPADGTLRSTEVLEVADVWTLPNALQARLPALRAHFESGLAVDVSLLTGEVMQATDSRGRLLAWLGPIPHWLYVTPLRRYRDPWRWVVMATSALALLALATGLWNGLRVVFRRGLSSPYRRPALRQHHRLGLAAGGVAVVWCLSGFFSVNPGHWSAGVRPTSEAFGKWGASPVAATPDDWAVCSRLVQPKRLVLWQVGTHRGVQCEGPGEEAFGVAPTEADLSAAASRLLGAPVEGRWEPLGAHDAYLTARAALVQYVGDVRLAADPRSCRLLQVLTASGRAERWLYQGLHTWDVGWLLEREGLRRTLQVAGVLAALALLATGLKLMARRLVGRR